MRHRAITLANVALALALVSVLGFVAGRQAADAQGGRPPVRASAQQKIAVVSVSRVLEQANDVRWLRQVVDLHDELTRVQHQKTIENIEAIERDLAAAEPNSAEHTRLIGDLNEEAAVVETLASVREYEKQLDIDRFARGIYAKLLAVIELEAMGSYDIVLRVVDGPVERVGGPDGRDLDHQLGAYRTRSVLFADTEAQTPTGQKRTPDLTDRILETMNSRGFEGVGVGGSAATAELRARIAEMEQRIEEARGD